MKYVIGLHSNDLFVLYPHTGNLCPLICQKSFADVGPSLYITVLGNESAW